MEPGDELELLARCRRGEPEAWDELFDHHYAAAGRFVYQLGPDFTREDTEEICQETFLSVVRSLAGFDGRSRVQTWIFRIASNKARDFRDRQQAAKRGGGQSPLSLQAEDPQTGLPLDPPSPASAPDDTLLRGERHARLRVALDELGEPCGDILELRYFGDLSYEEIGAALHLNLKTVSSRLSRCLDRLGELVRQDEAREDSAPSPVQ